MGFGTKNPFCNGDWGVFAFLDLRQSPLQSEIFFSRVQILVTTDNMLESLVDSRKQRASLFSNEEIL